MELIENGDLWALLGGATLVVMAVLAARGKLGLWGAVVGCLVVASGVWGTAVFAPHPSDALVTEDGVPMQVSPIDGGDAKGGLELGERVRVENRHGGYAYVRTEGGEAGWVPTLMLQRYFGDWGE